MVGVPRLARWESGPSSRIGWPLPWRTRSQPMNLGPISRPMNRAVAVAAPARKRDVAEEVEHPRIAKLFCDPEKHQSFPPASASTRAASPMEFDPLTSTASPGPIAVARERHGRRRVGHMRHFDLPAKRFRERLHLLADQDRIIDMRRPRAARRARRGNRRCRRPSSRIAPSTAIRRPAHLLLAEHLQRRRHRGRIGVVAFVDQQRLAAVDRDPVPLAAALEPAQLGQREPGQREIAAHRLDRGQHRQRIGHPMRAGLARS